VVDLPADVPLRAHTTGGEALSALLFYSAAISATRLSPAGTRYALRVNPSSGNLHPTEFHFHTHGLAGWPDGVYHYRPSQHMAEQRAAGTLNEEPLRFLLTTIAWREAWKYRARAYRYCLLDAGHAIESLVTAARAMGWDFTLSTSFDDDAVATAFRLAGDEWPMALVRFENVPVEARTPARLRWTPGTPNRLSKEVVDYPEIAAVHAATKFAPPATPDCRPRPGSVVLPSPAHIERDTAAIVRRRRSALDFIGGERRIALEQLSAILHAACEHNLYVRLWLFAHRVDGLEPGLYRYDQWTHSVDLIRAGDQRVAAAALSLRQDLAGNSVVTFSMTAPVEAGYRDIHFEAGRLGQRLYLTAEALGLQATGLGAFFDGHVLSHLQLRNEVVLYHFTIGYAVADPRL
jgi:SagB-type dehydrogenase family enzyme